MFSPTKDFVEQSIKTLRSFARGFFNHPFTTPRNPSCTTIAQTGGERDLVMRVLILFAALTAACAPSPTPMAPTQASELLAQFAAGATPADICTPQGRALLRGAVRAYGAEMFAAGVTWPASLAANPDDVSAVDVAVQVAHAAGFVEASDFRRARDAGWSFDSAPELAIVRDTARIACAEAAALQQAAVRLLLESARYQELARRAETDAQAAQRLELQHRLMQRAQSQFETAAAGVQALLARNGA
jgi:hypothetical protein